MSGDDDNEQDDREDDALRSLLDSELLSVSDSDGLSPADTQVAPAEGGESQPSHASDDPPYRISQEPLSAYRRGKTDALDSIVPDLPASMRDPSSGDAPRSSDRGGTAPLSRSSRRRPLLIVEHVSKVFPVRRGFFGKPKFLHAVEDVSFYIRRSETLGIVGESGSGKSTLAKAILRLTEPTFGRVLFDGRNITAMSSAELRALRRRMQIVFQDPGAAQNPRMTVYEIVGEGLSIFRMTKDEAESMDLVEKALALVGLPKETMERFPHELSGGQKQRVGIARALAVKPELLVCDEPMSALDVSVQAQIMNLLLRLQRDLGLSMLFISHDLRVVAHASHRVAVMFLGRIVEMGPTAAVCDKRYHPYTRALFDAVPKLGPKGRARLPIVTDLSADTPSAVDPPKGCVYATRCPGAEKGKCDVEPPNLNEILPGSHHRVACWHPEV